MRITFYQTDYRVNVHSHPLILRQVLVFFKLTFDSFSKLFPVKRSNNIFKMLLIQIIHFTKRINVKLNQNIVSYGLAKVKPCGIVFSFVFDVGVLVVHLI